MNRFFVSYKAKGWGSGRDYGSFGPPLHPDTDVMGNCFVSMTGPFIVDLATRMLSERLGIKGFGIVMPLEDLVILYFCQVDEETFIANQAEAISVGKTIGSAQI